MQFISNMIVTSDQIAAVPDLGPVRENLQRNVGVPNTIVTALRVHKITDRDTSPGSMKPKQASRQMHITSVSISFQLAGSQKKKKREMECLVKE